MSGSNRTFRVFALRLTALALLVNALVPAGFMLHPTEGAGLTMVLCPAQSPLPGYADDKHMQSAEASGLLALAEAGDENSCAFSLVGGPMLGSIPALLIPPDIAFSDSILLRTQPPLLFRRPSFAIRAPPHFS